MVAFNYKHRQATASTQPWSTLTAPFTTVVMPRPGASTCCARTATSPAAASRWKPGISSSTWAPYLRRGA